MARRRRSFFFDNINKRLLTDTTKNTKQSQADTQTATGTSNTQYTTLAQVEQKIARSDIDDLLNVTFSNLGDDQVLQYNSSSSKWENATLSLTSTISGLTDTSLSSLQNGQYLVYNSSNTTWINRSLDLSSYITTSDIASYSNTYHMNTAIAASNTAMKNYVDAEVSGIVNSAPSTLDTLNELAAALGDDANFATTTSDALGNRLRIDVNNQSLTSTQLTNARTNLGLGTAATTASTDYATAAQGTKADTAHGWGNHASAGYGTSNFSGAYADLTGKPSLFSGSYNDLSNKPTIPTNNNQLTNGAGYITGITSSMVTTALGYTPGTSSFSGSYNDLSNKPTIPTNNNQLTNGAGYTTTTAQELSRTSLSSSDDLGSGSSAPLSAGWYSWGNSQPSNSPDNYALMYQLNDGGQPQQWVMAYGGSANSVDLYARRRTGGSWDTTWTKFWNSTDFSSTNVSNWNTAYGWGNHASAGYSTFSGSYNDLTNKPTIPTNNNQLTNGAGYITSSSLSGYVSRTFENTSRNLVIPTSSTSGSAGLAMETSNGTFMFQLYGTGSTFGFLDAQWGNWDIKKTAGGALEIDISGTLQTVYHTGNLPTIPTNNNQLTNGAGYITNGSNYNVNNAWLRENGDNADVKLYGNSRQMTFRTDGTSGGTGGHTGYPFRWTYGGNADTNSEMLINTSGQLWLANYGWLHDAFLRKNASDTQTNTINMNGYFVGGADGHRHKGVFGNYNSYRINNIWSMGTSYVIDSNGGSFGNLYGMAYTYNNRVYTSNAMGTNHQMVWCINGTPKCALGANIWTAGNVTAYSDIRVKENLEIIPNALEKVKKLNGYTFDRTDIETDNEGNTPRKRQAGVIAQEVLEVLPEVVTGNEDHPDGQLSVAYGNMVGLLIEAIKEQQEQIEELKARLQ